jgi:hypothetical protein
MIVMRAIPFFLLCLGSVANVFAQPNAMRDAPTYEQLTALRSQAESSDPMKNLGKTDGSDPTKSNQPKSLLESSDIICHGGLATLVPKNAIVFLPKQYSNRMGMKPNSKIVPWLDFFSANRSWISTIEITIPQAQGAEPLTKASVERIETGTNLVVAVYQGGPISRLSPPNSK